MTKLGEAFVLSQEISIAAKEEASRWVHPFVDVDHLFLALLISGGCAGDVLRDLGIGLSQARDAVAATHAAQVASLGVMVAPPVAGTIKDPMITVFDWSPRALAVMKKATRTSDGLALLTAVIDEPSGLITAVLACLGVDPGTVRQAIAKNRSAPHNHAGLGQSSRWIAIEHSGFVPAPAAGVWALIADPMRRPEWDSSIGRVRPAGPLTWDMWAAATRPDGRSTHVREDLQRSRVRQIEWEATERIAWETTWPERGHRTGSYVLAITLTPVVEGTKIRLGWRLPRRPGWRRAQQQVLTPWTKVMTRFQLITATAQISRAFR